MFQINYDELKKIGIVVLVVMALSKIMTGEITTVLISLLLTVPGLLLAISVHEAAHALTAYKLGDDTAKNQGRISLNPFKHLDPIGIISLLIFRIGWGKPVEYNPRKINVGEIKKAEAKIAIAGPISNFILAIILAFVFELVKKYAPITPVVSVISDIIYIGIILNIGLGLFNLIPFPPLDGHKVFYKLYEGEFGRFVERNKMILSMIFLMFLFSGTIGSILVPINQAVLNLIFKFVKLIV